MISSVQQIDIVVIPQTRKQEAVALFATLEKEQQINFLATLQALAAGPEQTPAVLV